MDQKVSFPLGDTAPLKDSHTLKFQKSSAPWKYTISKFSSHLNFWVVQTESSKSPYCWFSHISISWELLTVLAFPVFSLSVFPQMRLTTQILFLYIFFTSNIFHVILGQIMDFLNCLADMFWEFLKLEQKVCLIFFICKEHFIYNFICKFSFSSFHMLIL